jgi:hypothetical protein
MLDRRLLVGSALTMLAAPAFAQTKNTHDNPLAAVKAFYDPKVKDEQRPYSRRLEALYAAATKKSQELNEPVSGLDFDPTIGGQDSDDDFRKTLEFATIPRAAGKATVEVRLRAFKTEPVMVLFYEVVREDETWRVDDIANPNANDGWRISALLEAGAKGQ